MEDYSSKPKDEHLHAPDIKKNLYLEFEYVTFLTSVIRTIKKYGCINFTDGLYLERINLIISSSNLTLTLTFRTERVQF